MAVNEKISAVLKDLPIRILTSSYNERKEIIHGIISIIDLPDITESIIKGVSKLLPSTLHSYRDQKSQGLVKSLIQSLLKHHPLWTSQHLSQAILNFASTYKSTNATNSVAKCLYAPLSWSFIILKSLDVSNEVNKGSFENLVKAQSILVAHVVASTNPKVLDSMFKSLCSMFQNSGKPSVLTEKYGEAILKFEQTSHTVILGSYFIKYLKAAKLEGDIAKYKTFLLDSFIKVTITKVQPPIYLIQQSQHLLATVTQEAFKTLFLPAIQRSMLRNPEILLPVIRYIIEQFVVDLSPYCLDLGKLLGANLYSKDDALRSAAVLTLRGLASRCSVGAEVEKLTKHLIGIFNGSEGKLTVPAYKMSVLEGIGNLSENKVTKDSDLLIKSTTEQLLKILDTEVHEKTLVVALQVLTAWVTHLSPSPLPLKDTPTPSLPTPLLASFKKALGAKALAPPVRAGYLNCLVSLGGDGGAREFLGDLIKSVERAQAQPTQAPIVHEAISASILLLRLSRVVRDDPKLNAVLESTILNTKKQVLLSEKILAQASPEVAYHAALLSTDILLNKSSQLQGSHSHLYRPILTCLTSPLWDLRRKGRALVKTLYGVEDRMAYALNLLGEFNTLLDTIPVKEFDSKNASSAAAVDASANKENKDSTSTSLEPGTPDHIASSQLYSSLVFLVSHPAFQYDDKERLALATLQPGCHEKIIAHVRARNAHELMLNVLRKLNIEDAKKFVLTHESTLVDTYIGGSTQANARGAASSAHNNVLRFLTRTNPAVIWTPIFEKLVDFFETTHLAISNDEYFTFLTPEGQIYDKTLLESLDANSDSHLTNLKRESKAYSYREQLEEIQLRKELEAKKAREGKQKQTQYTPKQKEAIKAQLDKEADIRKRVSKMNAELSRVLNLLRCAYDGNPAYISLNYNFLLPLLLTQLNSPLAAPAIVDIYLHLISSGIFHSEDLSFANTVARTTLRLASPKCDIDQAWTEEPLSRAIDRCLAYMSSLPSPLSGPGFCYCFQLIRLVLSRSGSETASDSSVATCLSVMITHSGLRHEDILNIRHPATLPRKHMFTLLLDLIGSGKLKPHLLNQLETTVLAVASSGSGATSCARASFDEISVLLAGLKHPLPLVRESTLTLIWFIGFWIIRIEKKHHYTSCWSLRAWIIPATGLHSYWIG
ncbi:hypothetical protein M8J77_012296 [Diaphorina citri]|nr:hypothetical protein M8J77_012296 [Diaphorina citri]